MQRTGVVELKPRGRMAPGQYDVTQYLGGYYESLSLTRHRET